MRNLLLLITLLLSAASCSTSVTSIRKTDRVYVMNLDKPWYYYDIYVDKKVTTSFTKLKVSILKRFTFQKSVNRIWIISKEMGKIFLFFILISICTLCLNLWKFYTSPDVIYLIASGLFLVLIILNSIWYGEYKHLD